MANDLIICREKNSLEFIVLEKVWTSTADKNWYVIMDHDLIGWIRACWCANGWNERKSHVVLSRDFGQSISLLVYFLFVWRSRAPALFRRTFAQWVNKFIEFLYRRCRSPLEYTAQAKFNRTSVEVSVALFSSLHHLKSNWIIHVFFSFYDLKREENAEEKMWSRATNDIIKQWCNVFDFCLYLHWNRTHGHNSEHQSLSEEYSVFEFAQLCCSFDKQ